MSYKGLCVGGIRAGEWVSKDANTFFDGLRPGLNILPDEVPLYIDVSIDADFAAIGTTYVHVAVEDVCDFWVPEGKTSTWALQELVRCYRRKELGREADPE